MVSRTRRPKAVPKAVPSKAQDAYAKAAREAGVPEDQFRNFLKAGIVLQPRQLAASAAARRCDAPDGPIELGYGGARGGGKSHWGVAQLAADDCQRFPGLKCLLLRKVGKANKENFEDLRRRTLMGIPHDYRRQEGCLVFPNDSRIITGHFQHEKDIDAYLGLEYDIILVEEATTLTTRKYRDISTCCRSSKPGWRPRLYSTTNPGGVGHAWYKARFVDAQKKRPADTSTFSSGPTVFISATCRDNAALNPEYIKLLEGLTGWQRRAWLDGDWNIAAGQYFTTFRADIEGKPHHVIPSFPIPKGWRVWGSLDYGFTHYTVFYLLAQDGDGNVYLVDEHGERGWLPQRHAPAILALLDRHGLKVDDLETIAAGHDCWLPRGMNEGGMTLAETYSELGIELAKANVDRIQGAAEILRRLGDADADPPIPHSLFVMDRCGHLVETLPVLEHDPHYPEKVLKTDVDEDGNGGDDWYDAARYGVMAAYHPPARTLESPW